MVSTVELLGEVDGGANGFLGFAGKSEDEVAVDEQSELLAVLGELARAFDGCALLDVLQDLRVARLVAHDEQAASRFLHRLQRFVVGGDARGAGPGHLQRLQLFAKLDGARLLNVEGVVVEEEFLHPGQYSLAFFISAATASDERLRHGCPLSVCGHRQKVHCAGQPRVV